MTIVVIFIGSIYFLLFYLIIRNFRVWKVRADILNDIGDLYDSHPRKAWKNLYKWNKGQFTYYKMLFKIWIPVSIMGIQLRKELGL